MSCLFALLTAGIPILIMDCTIGHKYRESAPLAFKRKNRKSGFIGWWAVLVAFVISTYYSVFSINLSWGSDPEGFFFN